MQRGKRRREHPLDETLKAGMLRLGARDPIFWGFLLATLRASHGQTVEQQAEQLGLTLAEFAYFSVCRRPRAEHHAADLASVAEVVGLTVESLAALLRQAADLRD